MVKALGFVYDGNQPKCLYLADFTMKLLTALQSRGNYRIFRNTHATVISYLRNSISSES